MFVAFLIFQPATFTFYLLMPKIFAICLMKIKFLQIFLWIIIGVCIEWQSGILFCVLILFLLHYSNCGWCGMDRCQILPVISTVANTYQTFSRCFVWIFWQLTSTAASSLFITVQHFLEDNQKSQELIRST